MAFQALRRRRWGAAAALVLGLAAWLVPAAADEKFESTISWLNDLGQARERAAEEGKPLYVVFRCVP